MATVIDKVLKSDSLVRLAQKDNFVGWVYGIDYEHARVMTNDLWKARVNGIPHNCFLVAATFDPDRYSDAKEIDREVLLLRVVSSAKLPQDDDLIRTKIDHFQDQEGSFDEGVSFDDLTLNQIQFGGLECRILGTFYMHDNKLWLGSDIESFSLASRLRVYRPNDEALEQIINHIDPIRAQAMAKDAEELGLKKTIDRIPIGVVRYTSTDRLHRKRSATSVRVYLQPADFLARRTAVLGMTRTGKSNMIKQTVSMVKRVAQEAGVPIGQIIFDINGEYANANAQDRGAISEVYKSDTVRYRGVETAGFEDLRHNFYVNVTHGIGILQHLLKSYPFQQADLELFKAASLDEPEVNTSEHKRWKVRVALFQCLLYKAGFSAPDNFKVTFEAGEVVREWIQHALQMDEKPKDPSGGLDLESACEWFMKARKADKLLRDKSVPKKEKARKDPPEYLPSSSGNEWFDEEARAFANLLAKKNKTDTAIQGFTALVAFKEYHSRRRTAELVNEIYEHLAMGKIVILDLSTGKAAIREEMSLRIAEGIFSRSMDSFVSGKTPPHVVIYVEEAHNLIGKQQKLTETWPRIAKEGAKYRIALVYATQEPSSVHPNILSNTENWFVTHLNNEGELKQIAQFYDFEDFSRSLIRAQDVGFARVKTLSGPFVIPVQIDLFDAVGEIARQERLKK